MPIPPIRSELEQTAAKSPFLLENEAEYRCWRQSKLEQRQSLDATHKFRIDDNITLAESLADQLGRQIAAFNFVLFETRVDLSTQGFIDINRRLGLRNLDANLGGNAVTLLQVADESDQRAAYIPYTNRALNWHTDGYYNPPDRRIQAFALFCVRQAEAGGESFLLDHELVYLLIRDLQPELLEALMAADMMMVPANENNGRTIRKAESGPVFSIDPLSGSLHMRYSSRPLYIVWKQDDSSIRALKLLRELLNESDAITELQLASGQGIVCNNILHGRHAFSDSKPDKARLFYRARFRDAVSVGGDNVLAG